MKKKILFYADRITDTFISLDLITPSDKNTYLYGMEVFTQSLIIWISVLFLGVITNLFIENLVFFVSYKILRKFTGGIHSSKFSVCYIISVFSNVMFLISIQHLQEIEVSKNVYIIVVMCLLILISFLSPVSDSNKPLSKKETNVYKIISITISIVLCVIAGIILRFAHQYERYAAVIIMAVLLDVILLVIGGAKDMVNMRKNKA